MGNANWDAADLASRLGTAKHLLCALCTGGMWGDTFSRKLPSFFFSPFFLILQVMINSKLCTTPRKKTPWGRSAGSCLCLRRVDKHPKPGRNYVPNRPGPQATGRKADTQLFSQTLGARSQKLFVKTQGMDSVWLGQTPVPPGPQKDAASTNAAPEEYRMSQERARTLHLHRDGFLPIFPARDAQ